MDNKSSSRGWIVTFSGTAINLALGALYTWSVFKGPLEEKFALSDKQSALPYSVAIIIFALMMVPAGRLQDKIGPRIVASVGGLLVGAGFFIASLARPDNALTYLVLGFGVLAGAGIGLGYASATPPAVKWFPPAKKGLIVGLVVGGFGLASVYVAPLTNYIIRLGGPTQAFFVLGIAFLIALLFFSQFLKNPPEGYTPAAASTPATKKKSAPAPVSARDLNWNEMMKTPQFYLIWLMYAFGAGAGLMMISFMAKHVKGLDIGIAGFVLVAILAIGNAGGRVISGFMSDKIGRTRTMLIVFLVQAFALSLFPGFTNPAILVVGTIIAGFNYGSCLSLFPSITADYYGLKNLGVNYGIVFTAWGVGGMVMPYVAGAIYDSTGSYTNAMYMAAGICILAAILTFVVKPPAVAADARAA